MVLPGRLSPIFTCNYEFIVIVVGNLASPRATFQLILPDQPRPAGWRVIIFSSAISLGGESAGAVDKRKASLHRASLSFSPLLKPSQVQQIEQFWTSKSARLFAHNFIHVCIQFDCI